ncbi:MAG: Gfo/Idh/MocA family oxidoreductase [Planctomycetes bacterium]|nr:Gfo/Idh/MocA family oxidoreductase [Planctomycetota bacterium]
MSLSRRDFLAATAASVGGLALAKSSNALTQDTADLRVAVIGFNGQGNGHIRNLKNRVVALCDVDQLVLQKRAQQLEEEWGHRVDTYTDYRRLLERDDIDAVSIATPNHTHALITVAAAQAGKHVYVEKPVAHNIWEGRQMVAAAKRYDRIIQCGTQSRSSPSLHAAVEFVRSGQLGKIQYALGTCYKPRQGIGKSDQPFQFPSHVDRDLWLGPASEEPFYRPKKNSKNGYNPHYDWHWDFNTGNGDMGNQGIHQMDIARWFLGENSLAPRVISIGGRLGYDDAGNTPNTQVTYLDYPAAPLIFETRGLPRSKEAQKSWGRSMDKYRGSDKGVIVQCERGHVLVPSYVNAIAYDLEGQVVKKWEGGGNHHENWLSAILAGDRGMLNADILEGHLSSSLCHVGAISHQLGEKLSAAAISERIHANPLLSGSFDRMAAHLRANDIDIDASQAAITLGPWLEIDTDNETFTNNHQASELRSRKQRAPFFVPDLERDS